MAVRVRMQRGSEIRRIASFAMGSVLVMVASCVPPSLKQAKPAAAHAKETGGFVLVYEFDGDKPAEPAETARILEDRLRRFGETDASVKALEDDRLEISLPLFFEDWLEHAYFMIENRGEVEFRVLAAPDVDVDLVEAVAASADDVGEATSTGRKWKWVRFDRSSVVLSEHVSVLREVDGAEPQVLMLVGPMDLDRSHLKSVHGTFDDADRPAISGELTDAGGRRMQVLTSRNLPDQSGRRKLLGIVLDDRLIAAPTINVELSDEFMIDLRTSMPRVASLTAVLNGEALPARLKQVSIERFDIPER